MVNRINLTEISETKNRWQYKRLYFIPKNRFRRVLLRVIIEATSGETQHLTDLSNGIIRPECLNYFSLLRQFWSNHVAAFF